jgi:hypothetical protein
MREVLVVGGWRRRISTNPLNNNPQVTHRSKQLQAYFGCFGACCKLPLHYCYPQATVVVTERTVIHSQRNNARPSHQRTSISTLTTTNGNNDLVVCCLFPTNQSTNQPINQSTSDGYDDAQSRMMRIGKHIRNSSSTTDKYYNRQSPYDRAPHQRFKPRIAMAD